MITDPAGTPRRYGPFPGPIAGGGFRCWMTISLPRELPSPTTVAPSSQTPMPSRRTSAPRHWRTTPSRTALLSFRETSPPREGFSWSPRAVAIYTAAGEEDLILRQRSPDLSHAQAQLFRDRGGEPEVRAVDAGDTGEGVCGKVVIARETINFVRRFFSEKPPVLCLSIISCPNSVVSKYLDLV